MKRIPAIEHITSKLALVVLLLSLSTAAQEDEQDIEFEEEFELIQDADVVFSASKHEQKVGFSPSAVVVITRKDIEESGATTLAELLRRWPVTHVYEFDPLYPAVEVRASYRTLLLVDGREVNQDLFVSPFYAALPIGLTEIERIEIVLGPSSAIYGANAVSAVINVITRQLPENVQAEAKLAAGEHGGLELDMSAGGKVGPARFRLSAGHSRSSSWMQQDATVKDVWRSRAQADFEIGPVELQFDGGFSFTNGKIFSIMGYLQGDDVWMPHAEIRFKYRDFKFRSYWYSFRGDLNLDAGLYYPPFQVTLGRIPPVSMQGDTAQTDVQFDLQPFSGNYLVVGADGRYIRYQSEQFVQDTIEEFRAGVFFHDEQKLVERWRLQAGLRFDWNSRTDWALSPRAAVIFNPAGEHYLRFSGGMAFRKPSLMETSMNFEIEADPAFPEIKDLFEKYGISNPGLGNELLSSVELGWKSSWWDRRLNVSMDGYAAMSRHVIGFLTNVVWEQTQLGPRLNLEKSQIGYEDLDDDQNVFGATIELEGKPADWLDLFFRGEARYAYFVERGDAENTWYPRYILAAGATFYPAEGWQGQLVFLAQGSTLNSLRNPESLFLPGVKVELPAVQHLLLYLGRSFTAGPVQLQAGVNFFNAFNSRFREEPGMISKDGKNFGGEILGRRLMIILQAKY